MSKSLTISIDNKEYNVIGENEEQISKSVNLLNEKIQEVASKTQNIASPIPSLTKTTLAALNIASMGINNELNYSNNLKDIVLEINKITQYINDNLEEAMYI